MDCTHIYLQIDGQNNAQFGLFDAQGVKVYEGHGKVTPRGKAISQYRQLDEVAREQVLRVITREHMDHDVGSNTPIFAVYA